MEVTPSVQSLKEECILRSNLEAFLIYMVAILKLEAVSMHGQRTIYPMRERLDVIREKQV